MQFIGRSTKTVSGQLRWFFSTLSICLGLLTFVVYLQTVFWAEDRVGERMILVEKDHAVERFKSGESGAIWLNKFTVAYNDLALVPDRYQKYLHRPAFLDEVEEGKNGRLLLLTHYDADGKSRPLVLMSDVDLIELGVEEGVTAGLFVVLGVGVLLLLFHFLLTRLTQSLINPINTLSEQLDSSTQDTMLEFAVNENAASEYQRLAAKMNADRKAMHELLHRERAFARYTSHELRTPLTIIKGSATLLARQPFDAFQARQIQRIKNASTGMEKLVAAMLSLVKYERAIDETTERQFSHDEVQDIITQFERDNGHLRVPIRLSFIAAPVIAASTTVMALLLNNLLRNAASAAQHGEIVIEVDTGFIRVINDASAAHHKEDGHGLGLMIAEDFCRRFQWHFELRQNQHGCVIAEIKL